MRGPKVGPEHLVADVVCADAAAEQGRAHVPHAGQRAADEDLRRKHVDLIVLD